MRIQKETYKPDDVVNGILQKNYYKYQNFVKFKGLSYYNKDMSNETVILDNNNINWESFNKENSSISVYFRKHKVKLSSIYMMSCTGRNCVFNIEATGSNDGFLFEYACSIKHDVIKRQINSYNGVNIG